MTENKSQPSNEKAWQDFIEQESLSDDQGKLFAEYQKLLLDWNNRMNLTAITDPQEVIAYHFQDSLALAHAVDLANVRMIADVGSGAGFPGIPLKIAYPHLTVLLIEVNQKRIRFLKTVIQELKLSDIHIVELDWLTFVRKTHYKVNFFCARASLRPEDLVPLFDVSKIYAKSSIVYWASMNWQASEAVVPFIQQKYTYTVGEKTRKLIFLQRPQSI